MTLDYMWMPAPTRYGYAMYFRSDMQECTRDAQCCTPSSIWTEPPGGAQPHGVRPIVTHSECHHDDIMIFILSIVLLYYTTSSSIGCQYLM